MKVLGVDPGTGRMGWAIVEKTKGKETLIDCGCLETPANTFLPIRLEKIYLFLNKLITKHKPESASIEDLFFAKNRKTVMSVGAARGVIILACKQAKLNINLYTPLQIKSSITGYGQADKKQMQFMVKNILKLKEIPEQDDAIDAVAAALTHLSRQSSFRA
ncbi:crossover junction endodeoxyribonuclease RuvC [Patescibacteria group bacterium]|nr:crossover junction endodeoxyribonuclease RuvC [Patescibacteria group bacterium]MBU1256380.1 crossover junction endodeoxyribonuclease RuvC [Patescibacteria group bacterium]MBU1457777.1 crossover junction endodeoxyribonuclease RuvC [Patescibacteria group bacterium]